MLDIYLPPAGITVWAPGVHVSHYAGGRTVRRPVRRRFSFVRCAGILLIAWDFVR